MRIVVVRGVPIEVKYEEWFEPLAALSDFLDYGTPVPCRLLLRALYILEKLSRRREIYSLYVELDSLLAEMLKEGKCGDLE